jgi:hypothetical protein
MTAIEPQEAVQSLPKPRKSLYRVWPRHEWVLAFTAKIAEQDIAKVHRRRRMVVPQSSTLSAEGCYCTRCGQEYERARGTECAPIGSENGSTRQGVPIPAEPYPATPDRTAPDRTSPRRGQDSKKKTTTPRQKRRRRIVLESTPTAAPKSTKSTSRKTRSTKAT